MPWFAAMRKVGCAAFAGRQQLFSLADCVGDHPPANHDLSPDGQYFARVRRSPSPRIMIIQSLPTLAERLCGLGGTAP